MGIEFDTRTHIDRIQIIASKLMVSSAIDIFVGDDTNNPDSPEYKKAKFMHLGNYFITGSPHFTRFHFTRFTLYTTFRKITSLLVKFTLYTEKNSVK